MRHRGGWGAWLVASLLHMLVALLLVSQTSQSPPTRRAVEPAARVNVRLLNAQSPAATGTVTRSIAPPRRATRHLPPQATVQPTPAFLAPPVPITPDETPTSIETPATSAQPLLNLTLPVHAASAALPNMVNAALNDPRSNSRPTQSERFAANLGTNTDRIEERMADGKRVRQGTSCYLVRETRASTLGPFNQSVAPMLKVTKPCP